VLDERGRVRWTLDLTPIHDFRGDVQKLAWSPDGSRLAIATHADIWLVEGDGDPQLASSPGRIWNLSGWSPDGQSLLVDQYAGQHAANVVVLHLATDGSPTMTEQTLYQSDRHFDWAGNLAWSPDGTRIAVRTSSSIVEISAEDGSVLARHPHLNGWLIWPARDHS
jgi:WD40 repeat protein